MHSQAASVINLALDWQQASGAAAGLAVATLALRAARRPLLTRIASATLESGLILGLYALWQFAGSHSALGLDGAFSRARWIWRLERDVRLPSEAWLQRLFLPHPLLIQFFDLYYDILHFPVLIACMVWLFVWHRADYGRWRTTLVAFTGLCLLVQLIPVAPPRMLPATGMVDTATLYHQSVYSSAAGFDPDQLSAMPSVHVGWAILVAVAVIRTLRSRWRWLAVTYPVMTTLAVIVTANHFWLDGIVAAAILAVVLAAQAQLRGLRWARSRPALRLVAHDDAQRLREYRRSHRQLCRADNGAVQRVLIDYDAEGGAAQVRALHGDLGQVDPGQLRAGKPALREGGAEEVDVAQHAMVKRDVREQ
jgi:PAP2 superfamily